MTVGGHRAIDILTVVIVRLHMRRAEGFATLTALAVIRPLDLCVAAIRPTDAILLNHFI